MFQKNEIILSFILLFAFVQSSTAQYRFGLSGGLTVSSHTGKDFSATDFPKIGMAVGFFYEREINRTISWVIEPSFEQKGADYSFYPRFDTRVTVDNDLNYFTLPVMLKANFGRKINYYVTGGTALSYLYGHKSEVHAYENDFEIDAGSFFPYSFNAIDVSLSIGGGIMWKEIFLDLRYVYGVKNFYSGNNVPDIRNHMLSLKLAYSLYRKKNTPCYKRR